MVRCIPDVCDWFSVEAWDLFLAQNLNFLLKEQASFWFLGGMQSWRLMREDIVLKLWRRDGGRRGPFRKPTNILQF